ncbi:MAG: amidohydrolase family protein [Bacteroidia bacterium]
MKKLLLSILIFIYSYSLLRGQETFPVNGITDKRHTIYAFTHGRIYKDYKTILEDATLIIKDNIIRDIGANITIPAGAIIYDLKGKSIFPSFIDPFGDYGIQEMKSPPKENQQRDQYLSNVKGAFGWNQAVRPELDAYQHFVVDNKKAELLRNIGFGMVCAINKDGIVRGTACAVTLADQNEHEVIIKDKVAACLSFNKGSSAQDYPGSLMGCIALIRQTYLDAEWYKNTKEEYNISLDAFNKLQNLPQLFEVSDKQNALRADKIGDEFNVKYIIKGAGDEYQRINEIKNTGCPFIIPVNYPDAYDVSDPWDAANVSLSYLKNWELAPTNAAALEKAVVPFAFTADGLKEKKDFLKNIRKAIEKGLSKEAALKALTQTPAELLQIQDKVGSLNAGMLANFIITSKNIFDKDNVIYENWCSGKQFIIKDANVKDVRGNYTLNINDRKAGVLKITGELDAIKATVEEDTNKITASFTQSFNQYLLTYESKRSESKGMIKLDGYYNDSLKLFKGTGVFANGNAVNWTAKFDSAYIATVKKDTTKIDSSKVGDVWFPNMAYGWKELPKQKTVLIKNATVWTNEDSGILKNTDVLIKDGKIAKVGQNLDAAGAEVVDATGKHVTTGIIDEHSHIAISGDVNECTQAVTAEVRIGDVVDADDIDTYRQLAGGVTSSHLLHGSCNPVGGQTQLTKHRWGMTGDEMKFFGWPGFIKFALGENVKESNWGDNAVTRYPQTRMGVEQVYVDAFTRAREYDNKWKSYNSLSTKLKGSAPIPRRDLELDALAEILNSKRFITCHSYEQSEINMLMHVADSFGFKVNTFTHILEGYKVADKMKAHGAGASSFSDWWAYKYEVYEAIPYNGKILHDMGVTVAFNSDDAEMARRLNQEAAKAVKFGNVSEEEALKFVTLNPAKLLHVDDKVGSIKVGKDADLVIWSDDPLSIYATVLQTYVDGICYYDVKTDLQKREDNKTERARLVAKMLDAKSRGEKTQKVSFTVHEEKGCMGIEH